MEIFIDSNTIDVVHFVTYRIKTWGTRKAEIHLENAEIHLKIVQMNLQWIENDEISLKKLNSS